MKISKNFEDTEYSCTHKIINPDPRLVLGMQKYRDIIGVPIKITSGGRCALCGESINTPHFVSDTHPHLAADSIAIGKTLLEMYRAALQVEEFAGVCGGIGIYPYSADEPNRGFLHLDVRTHQVARWSRVQGVYKGHQDGLTFIRDNLKRLGFDVNEEKIAHTNGYEYITPVIGA